MSVTGCKTLPPGPEAVTVSGFGPVARLIGPHVNEPEAVAVVLHTV